MSNNRENPSRPIVGVGAVIVRGNDVVLIKRGKPPKEGEWSLPGGGVDVGETVKEAVVREIHEETSLTVTLGDVIDVVDYIEPSEAGGTKFHYILLDYLAFYCKGTLKPGSDAVEANFFSFDEAIARVKWDETKRILRQARRMTKKNKKARKCNLNAQR